MPPSTFCSIHSFFHSFIHAFNNNNRGKQTFPFRFSSRPSREVLLRCLQGWALQAESLFRVVFLVFWFVGRGAIADGVPQARLLRKEGAGAEGRALGLYTPSSQFTPEPKGVLSVSHRSE